MTTEEMRIHYQNQYKIGDNGINSLLIVQYKKFFELQKQYFFLFQIKCNFKHNLINSV